MKHSIELTDEQIKTIAEGLSGLAWMRDHCAPYENADAEASHTNYLREAKALCESLESLLPAPIGLFERVSWPDDLKG